MAKKKIVEDIKTPEQIHEELFACINCKYEKECLHVFPFPLNLCEKCVDYIKKDFVYDR